MLICCSAKASPPTVDVIICIVSLSSSRFGKSIGTSAFCTISNAKKTPLSGALKPALTPAAAPQASSNRSRDILLFTL